MRPYHASEPFPHLSSLVGITPSAKSLWTSFSIALVGSVWQPVAPAENQPVAVAMANYVNKEKKPWQPYNTAYSDISEDVREPASVRQAWTDFMQERDGMDYSVAANPVPDPRQRRFVQLVDLQPATIVKNSDQSRLIHLKEKGLVVQNGERQYDLYLQRGDMYVTDLEKRVLAHPYVRQSKESVKYNGNKLLNSSTDCHEAPYNLRFITHDQFWVTAGLSRNTDRMVNGIQVTHIWICFPSNPAHYWASWMEGCAEAPKHVKKKSRPSWYDAHISGPPEWTEIVYGGFRRETWAYAAY